MSREEKQQNTNAIYKYGQGNDFSSSEHLKQQFNPQQNGQNSLKSQPNHFFLKKIKSSSLIRNSNHHNLREPYSSYLSDGKEENKQQKQKNANGQKQGSDNQQVKDSRNRSSDNKENDRDSSNLTTQPSETPILNLSCNSATFVHQNVPEESQIRRKYSLNSESQQSDFQNHDLERHLQNSSVSRQSKQYSYRNSSSQGLRQINLLISHQNQESVNSGSQPQEQESNQALRWAMQPPQTSQYTRPTRPTTQSSQSSQSSNDNNGFNILSARGSNRRSDGGSQGQPTDSNNILEWIFRTSQNRYIRNILHRFIGSANQNQHPQLHFHTPHYQLYFHSLYGINRPNSNIPQAPVPNQNRSWLFNLLFSSNNSYGINEEKEILFNPFFPYF